MLSNHQYPFMQHLIKKRLVTTTLIDQFWIICRFTRKHRRKSHTHNRDVTLQSPQFHSFYTVRNNLSGRQRTYMDTR